MKRLLYIDNLKCLAIFLVIIGHSIQFVGGGKNDILFELIYSFHMPLFMMLSGFFFLNSLKLDFGELLKKKGMKILWPSILWSVPKMIYSANNLQDFMNVIVYNFWFLKSVFLCYIIYYLLYKLTYKDYIVGIIIVVVSSSISLDVLPGELNIMLPFFGLGVMVKKYSDSLLNKNLGIDLLLLMIFISMFVYNHSYGTSKGAITIIDNNVTFDLNIFSSYCYYMAKAAIVSVLFVRVFYRLNINSSLISYLGQNTLCIYLMNIFCCDLILHLDLSILYQLNQEVRVLFVTTIQIVIFYYLIKQIDKCKRLKFILLGT